MHAWLRFLAWLGGALFVAVGILYMTLFDVWTLPGDDPLLAASIEPTLSAGDVVVLARHGSVARGALLRCPDPQAAGRFVVARAIARSGERVDIAGDLVSVDQKHTPSPRACDPPHVVIHDPNTNDDVDLACSVEDYGEFVAFGTLRSTSKPEPPTTTTVDSGRWYLVSDDRHVHLDSRDFGQIDSTGCQHILFRLVGSTGFGDAKKRLTIVW